MAQSIDTPMTACEDFPIISASELPQQNGSLIQNSTSTGPYSSSDSLFCRPSNNHTSAPIAKSYEQQEEMFQLIKAQCSENPILFEKVVNWGVRNSEKRGASEEERKSLSEGRLWVIAHTSGTEEGRAAADSLDDIKGAYQKDASGVYKQPDPEACGSGVRHRLHKDQNGRWMIERQCNEQGEWQVRARQLDDGRWIDLNSKTTIQVDLVPMSSILERIGKQDLESKSILKKRIDFLFSSCNQGKLCKLKGRNLKHHIANLKVKLEKRYALNFGVQLATTAEIIRQELKPSAVVFKS